MVYISSDASFLLLLPSPWIRILRKKCLHHESQGTLSISRILSNTSVYHSSKPHFKSCFCSGRRSVWGGWRGRDERWDSDLSSFEEPALSFSLLKPNICESFCWFCYLNLNVFCWNNWMLCFLSGLCYYYMKGSTWVLDLILYFLHSAYNCGSVMI